MHIAHFNGQFYKSHQQINIILNIIIPNVRNNVYIRMYSCKLDMHNKIRHNIKKNKTC